MKKLLLGLFLPVFLGAALIGCKEDIDESARYVFKEKTISDYLKNHEEYSEYVRLLYEVPVSEASETSVGNLLSARGRFTVFAPTNQAIQNYLDTLAASVEDPYITSPSWDSFTDSDKRDSIKKLIVLNSVIDSGDNYPAYQSADFPEVSGGEFSHSNLNDRKLSIFYSDSPDSVYVNKDCLINPRNKDIILLNGYIHQVERVVAPSDLSACVYLKRIIQEQRDGFLVMARAIEACGLLDTLNAMRDEVYEELYNRGYIESYGDIPPPRHRLYGFTIFSVTDDYWRAQGLNPTDPDLMLHLTQWIQEQHQYSDDDVFTTDENYSDPGNLLYQWVTYHILPMRVPSDKLIIHNPINYPLVPVPDYFITFGKRRLIKVFETAKSDGVRLNRFANLDYERTGNGKEVSCDPDKEGIRINVDDPKAILSDIANCCIYPIERPLAYDDATRNNLFGERLRFDVMALFPETMTNDIRCKKDANYNYTTFPPQEVYNYCRDMQLGNQSRPRYSNYPFTDLYFGDELLIYGNYDVTLHLPPVPRTSTYEVRIGYIAQFNRGIAQFYFGTDPDRLPVTGIPLDMTRMGENLPGYESDSEDQDYNAELDKKMRNYGLMKGPLSMTTGRTDERLMRTIVAKNTITPDKDYYLRMKSVIDSDERQSVIDFIELCPKEVYDSPNKPEDIW